ncbi:hypothetical protein [Rubinisphaera margarita]|uniref:hypothetical protein n=1 Tax=Rubinisphaera margarita TaxID=2909586 RepID=UPI001EE8C882|nr:hypothetical protein [Rubinisphaera margarita]MCG6156243.1 hypothetical protein [Rubinisphaera margarita]
MARSRRNADTLEAGSDSFLDIVANIVGILIILIVIAGVRMSQAPTIRELIVESTPVPVEVILPPLPAALSHRFRPEQATTAASRLEQIDAPVLGSTAVLNPVSVAGTPPIADLSTLDPLRLRNQSRSQSNLARSAELAKLAAERDRLKTLIAAKTAASAAYDQQMHDLNQREQQLAVQRAAIVQQLTLMESTTKTRRTIEHQVVPVSRVSTGQEWHFELREGKVAYIPLSELIDQVRAKVQQRLGWIAKYGTYESVIGPTAGFSMRFIADRESKSLVDEITTNGQVRIVLQQWELVPVGDATRETLKEASRENSLFQMELQRISRADTITFWVYPDSFELYQELSRQAQARGYHVAARPLPQGKLITGSPQGSKSLSQ